MSRAGDARRAQAEIERGVQIRQEREARAAAAAVRREVNRGPTGVGAIIASIAPALPFPAAAAPLTRLEIQHDRVERLEELEDQVTRFLAMCAPATWADTRRALFRILRRARRELRDVERDLA